MELLKVFLWRILNYPKIHFEYLKSKIARNSLMVFSSEKTIEYILSKKCSVSRFGDGEFQMIAHYVTQGSAEDFLVDSFQSFDYLLAKRLYEVLNSNLESHLVCIPYAFKDSRVSCFGARLFWEREWNARKSFFVEKTAKAYYGDTNFTRFYMDRKDIVDYPRYISLLKKIWNDENILIVEGKMSRLGVKNDLFDNAKSINRILCPSKNAFSVYETILKETLSYGRGKLVLIALGHTATVLAYDLAKLGYWVIDIGHVDIEYEWYKMGAKKKVTIPNKYVNEVSSGRISDDINDIQYHEEVLVSISE